MELIDRIRMRLLDMESKKDELDEIIPDEVLEELIMAAREKFIELRYPLSAPPVDSDNVPIIESRWDGWLISVAIEIYSKSGAEGQISHSENGITRTYQGADISPDLRARITPIVGIARGRT